MKVGLVGFSQSGKSTLFELLTGAAPDPASGLKGQLAIAKVADSRLDFLADMFQPKKKTAATVEFIDTPGLLRSDKADNPQRLATLRTADGLLVVLDAFSADEAPTVQLERFREELLFADFEVVSNRIEKLKAGSKKPKPPAVREQEAAELADLEAMAAKLEAGESLHGMQFSEAAEKQLKSFQLFSLKPEMIVVNRREDQLNQPADEKLLALNPHTVVTSIKLERDLAALEESERGMFMEEMGLQEFARDRIIQAAYASVGLISFFTVGEDECKAWTVRQGANAVEAAGKIHSDIARAFIRAEVVAYSDLKELGNMKEVRAKGLQRLEGKEYRVADGDIINFRHGG